MAAVPRLISRTRRGETTEAIRTLVLDGVVPTGSRLKDQDLAEALGVSRATVREAVRQLVHEGILIHEPYRGLRVADLDDQAVLDLSEVRAALETLAGERVTRSGSTDSLARLDRAVDAIAALRNSEGPGPINETHIAFHRLIQQLAGNPFLEQVWDVIEKQTRLVLRIDREIQPNVRRLVVDHRALVDVFRGGDPREVEAAVRSHVLGQAERVLQLRAARRSATVGSDEPRASEGRRRGVDRAPTEREPGDQLPPRP
jgi:DNA-binding GntR family transcriptional regulator